MALGEAKISAVLPAVDIKRAKKFYQDTLGLKLVKEDPGPGAMFEAGKGTRLYVYQRAQTKADHTAVSFGVKDVEAHVKELKTRGVKFEEYDLPKMGIKTVGGIATMDGHKSAWFKDTEGNILALEQM